MPLDKVRTCIFYVIEVIEVIWPKRLVELKDLYANFNY